MVATGIVRGKRLRATRVGHCGLPIAGEKSTIVTSGFVTVSMTKAMRDAEDLEQANADGQICIADRTPPELKWYEFSAEFCAVDPELLSFFTDDALVLDYANKPVGFRSSKRVKVNEGAGVELWTGVGADDCVLPTDDSVLSEATATAPAFGYFVLPYIKEATMGDFEIGANVMTFTISGITGAAPMWGKGPYNVVAQDAQNTAGRLLSPFGADEHLHFERTTIAPPAVTDGAVELTLPTPYFAAVGGGEEAGG
ncbi:hypothetical protein B842_03340 [Corynebacterium humireducens NBRC 106098 = DSM 45392]|uniref:Major tail protein n=1 Tax=Corynebacterium humireducens NBRC 106098 = DSM 45392 TaxID=1223515 RepID=A0A0B5D1L3_9CORY|nr:hypothetical protein [Corynebacterium humireducens]AJE32521.1 hypothetical protein B842_03340 [Corynebacterium humireducens NBRC 106098 = DSM 45392]